MRCPQQSRRSPASACWAVHWQCGHGHGTRRGHARAPRISDTTILSACSSKGVYEVCREGCRHCISSVSPSLHLRRPLFTSRCLPGEPMFPCLRFTASLPHYRISRVTSTPGPFFIEKFALATERYVTFFRRMHLCSENGYHHPVMHPLGCLNSDLAFIPPEIVLRATPVPRVLRPGALRSPTPAYNV